MLLETASGRGGDPNSPLDGPVKPRFCPCYWPPHQNLWGEFWGRVLFPLVFQPRPPRKFGLWYFKTRWDPQILDPMIGLFGKLPGKALTELKGESSKRKKVGLEWTSYLFYMLPGIRKPLGVLAEGLVLKRS